MDAQATFSSSMTQSELIPVTELPGLPLWPARRLLPRERQDLAVQILAGTHSVAELAQQYEVSRKFLCEQADTARDALTHAFNPEPRDEHVLFYLPVTKAWLRQLVLGLVLIGHAPYRAVVELFRDLFDWTISLGTVHNIVRSAVEPARAISRSGHLAGKRIGTPHEILLPDHPACSDLGSASKADCARIARVRKIFRKFFPQGGQ